MPQNVALAAFIFGAILVLIALLGGGFELFGAKILGQVAQRERFIADTVGTLFILIGLLNPFEKLNTLPLSSIPTAAPTSNLLTATLTQPIAASATLNSLSPTAVSPTVVPPTLPVATSAPIPTTTPDNTVLGTILEVGQTWKQDGAELTLVNDVGFQPNLVTLHWRFTNHTGRELLVNYGNENFSARDNLDNQLTIIGFRDFYSLTPNVERVLKPGESIENTGTTQRLNLQVDLKNKRITYIIVTVTDIYKIEKAQWKIPVTLH